MTNSQKLLKKIMLYAFGIGIIPGIIALLSQYIVGGDGGTLGLITGGIAGVCSVVLVLTFIAFLISLIVASNKGQ